MGKPSTNTVALNELAIKKVIAEGKDQPRKEWRVEKIATGKQGEKRTPLPGLILVTQPTGTGTFYYFYRDITGRMRKLRLGEFASVGTAGGLELWERHSRAVHDGEDPVGNKHALRVAMTFKELAQAFLSSGALAADTRKNYKRQLETHIYSVIGSKPAETVTGTDVLAICRKHEARGHYALSNMLKSIIGGVYRYGREQGLSKANPVLGIGRRGQKVARDRSPTDPEISAIWRAVELATLERRGDGKKLPATARLSKSMALIIKLAIVTGQRRTEVCGARVDELHGLDGKSPAWIIKGDENKRGKIVEGRTKNGRTQVVPLSPLAVALFKEALEQCAGKEFIFPADTSRAKTGKQTRLPHIHGESVSKAVLRLRGSIEGMDSVLDVTVHDMRRAISNLLKNEGVSREVRDLVLNHLDPSVTEANYSQLARMTTQVRAALEAWSAHIEKITGQGAADQDAAGSNVVPLRA